MPGFAWEAAAAGSGFGSVAGLGVGLGLRPGLALGLDAGFEVRLDFGSAAPALFGRARELDLLERAAETAWRCGRLVPALISGDAGAGKTALAEVLAYRLGACGWTPAWGRSPEHEGASAGRPWSRVVAALTAVGVPEPAAVGGIEGSATTRFGAHRAAAAYVTGAAGRGPLLLVFDDLHRAGEETLALLTALVAEAVAGPVLLVGTYRASEVTPELTGLLAEFARADPTRVYAGALSEEATAELVRNTLMRDEDVEATAVRVIHRRSAGNPFFARELARLYESEGSAALAAVPTGARDVIRHRVARLPESARTVLRRAAVLGRDIDLDVLISALDDEELVLDA
ncbi:AAA family ATPase, partial [Streptomyces sp. SID3343]|uniref:AAA family ATPase n=1 Tax=Streptomyces sp. SID3343 TaxID=2690260 RepID=UPI00136B99FC|nr:AAA family ATPase [Streptomyces sp. SID3343]